MTVHAQTFLGTALSKSDQARLRLLEAAVECFGARGMDGASVREIARAAGQNVAAIAYYFGGKEQLYHAAMEGIVREVKHRLAEVLEEAQAARERGAVSPAQARDLLRRLLRTVYLRILSRNEAAPIARLIVRELMEPGAGFEILYRQGFCQIHELLCWLVGCALGRDPKHPETIVRTHTLMGQVYFFVMSRAAILRRAGWPDLESHAELVVEVFEENIETLLRALAARKGRR